MKAYKPKIKDFPEQALLVLEKQKKDQTFSKYVKTILMERYLSNSVQLKDLHKKLKTTKNTLQKDALLAAITTRLLTAEQSQIVRAYQIMEEMSVDELLPLIKSNNKDIKDYAKNLATKHQLQLEEELSLDLLDVIKSQEELEDANQKLTKNKEKPKIPKKRQRDSSITTRKFLQDFFGIECLNDKNLNHEQMEEILQVEGITIPKRGRLQNISYDQVATGQWILVRGESHKGKGINIIPYRNPYDDNLEQLAKELNITYKKRR